MEAEGHIDTDTRARMEKIPVQTIAKGNITGKSAFVYEKVRQEVIELLGYEAVSKGGFIIHTTIDSGIQEVGRKRLREQLAKIEQHPDFNHGTTLEAVQAQEGEFQESAHPDQTFPAPKYLQGALLMIDNKTGATIARVGGRDFNDSMFDRVSQGRRPPAPPSSPLFTRRPLRGVLFPGHSRR
jgi:membrane carboxypeptidase/penicillin-binding protein